MKINFKDSLLGDSERSKHQSIAINIIRRVQESGKRSFYQRIEVRLSKERIH
jgi:hypothetical protein